MSAGTLIDDYLFAHAERTPSAAAVRYDNAELDYETLATRALGLADVLRTEGVARGDRVALGTGRGLETAIGLYGILAAGAAYVPVDVFAPPARISRVLREAEVRIAVSTAAQAERFTSLERDESGLECVVGARTSDGAPRAIAWDEVAAAPATPRSDARVSSDLAYIIFTSGSTGVPKGIMHSHASSLAFSEWAARTYDLGPLDRLANHSPLVFDLSVFDFFAGVIAGACTVIVPEGVLRLPASYAAFLAAERISVLCTVPFTLSALLARGALDRHDLSTLRLVVFGGDVHAPRDLRTLLERWPHTRVSHVYGPAETNCCTFLDLDRAALPDEPHEPFAIGHPCGDLDVRLFDEDGRPTESDSGEVHVAGPSVMLGYWRRPDLDRSAFRSGDDGRTRYYRTGDRARRGVDGALHFVGRIDRQVKVRGFRIELEEVETAMLALDEVEDAAAYAVDTETGAGRLLAAAQPRPGATIDAGALQRELAARLPPYAVPETILVLDEFPRTASGKADRRALLARHGERATR